MKKILSNTEINPVDEENFLWDFMQAFEEYKKDNQSRWITHRELFKEFVQSLQISTPNDAVSDTTEAK